MIYPEKEYPLQKESYQIIGICMEVHRILGEGLLEIVYKDAIDYEFNNKKILMNERKNMQLNTRESFYLIISCKHSVPLFGKEGSGEILLNKSPLFKGGGECLLFLFRFCSV